MENVHSRHETGGADFIYDLRLDVGRAVRILRMVDVISAGPEKLRRGHLHELEAAALGESDVALDGLRTCVTHEIDRSVGQFVAPVFHARRKRTVALQRIQPVENRIVAGIDRHDRAGSAQLDGPERVCAHETVAGTPLGADLRVLGRGENADGRFAVPLDVEPFAEILPVLHRQLDDPELFDRRRGEIKRHGQRRAERIRLFRHYEILKFESDIVVGGLDSDDGIVGRDLETDDQAVALTADAVGLIDGAAVRMDEFYFVVERTKLRDRTERDRIVHAQQLFAAMLRDKRFDDGVGADRQPEAPVLDHHIARTPGRSVERSGKNRYSGKQQFFQYDSFHFISFPYCLAPVAIETLLHNR